MGRNLGIHMSGGRLDLCLESLEVLDEVVVLSRLGGTSFSTAVAKTQCKEEWLFQFTVSEGSALSCLAPRTTAGHHGGRVCGEQKKVDKRNTERSQPRIQPPGTHLTD